MAKKKTSAPPKNDFAAEEELDVCGFSDDSTNESNGSATNPSINPIIAPESTDIKTIDFNNSNNNSIVDIDNSTDKIIDKNSSNTSTASSSQIKTMSNNENIVTDNRKSPIVNGCAPPINGEYWDVKRTYMLRGSTVRKLNELKSLHHDLNTYVSTLVDLAIANYYEHIINEGGRQ